jgi:hypothetical protein
LKYCGRRWWRRGGYEGDEEGIEEEEEAGFEVFTAVVMNSTSLWDITPCSSMKFRRRFGGKISA